uniref:Arf-GAP domain-containing protein n=1 Tax=Neobodo designis TaxID=312471 RepID=A0A7S1W3Q2_NEODS|mmetsp:Transcript_5152/g.16362  ORF Transcript_5152/g.16362 Transcript_5152/m.16362 type:complete len:257 (+) Transcript_5152:40-810(+)|eukprot:CAMPEP_0174827798 /NCGR_PEP_ID=MMETSP1114-20130205/936_1 /TAXON_ID=312471 /ORGANISM="Neobodo designis, Strain CCAP 1951/1" /LENGTH=256 /DNA_ID=CAMNT_0016061475 /DNA_START=40 /DNA_END=810 /DNA_ORIENTATION=-
MGKGDRTGGSDEVPEDWDANRATIEELCRQSPNDTCNDCGASGTRWVSVNHGVFVCIRCSGIHRSLGSHITKVKSTNLDKWTVAEIAVMRQIGNARGKELWEARFPRGQRPLKGSESDNVVRSYIVQKYEHKTFADEEWQSTLKRVYKSAGYKAGLKALKAAPASPSTAAPADFYEEAASPSDKKEKRDKSGKKDKKDKKEKKEKKEKSIYGAFGLVTVPTATHDEERSAVLAAFGIETAVDAAAPEVADDSNQVA